MPLLIAGGVGALMALWGRAEVVEENPISSFISRFQWGLVILAGVWLYLKMRRKK